MISITNTLNKTKINLELAINNYNNKLKFLQNEYINLDKLIFDIRFKIISYKFKNINKINLYAEENKYSTAIKLNYDKQYYIKQKIKKLTNDIDEINEIFTNMSLIF